ncbi:TatD family hydrolase [Niabella hibiscisoli]|nr:TatD family hydrolase [Niabella hibiscisoli]MCH5721144.1 TatD family hydrolase [Niabella hibiscisoli]
MFIDTHAHIYSEQLLEEKNEFLERALRANVTTVLMPAIDTQSHKSMLDMEAVAPVTCLSMMGLHPCSVKEDFKQELDLIGNYLEQRKFVAIGETGLDFYWDVTFKEQQYIAFKQQIEWAIQYDLPIVIHSRSSTKECIDVVSQYTGTGLRGVFHCFGGAWRKLKRLSTRGFIWVLEG